MRTFLLAALAAGATAHSISSNGNNGNGKGNGNGNGRPPTTLEEVAKAYTSDGHDAKNWCGDKHTHSPKERREADEATMVHRRRRGVEDEPMLEIKVAFHMIYKSDGTGDQSEVPPSMRQEQINVLNAAFSGVAPGQSGAIDTKGTDTRIRFIEASSDFTQDNRWYDRFGRKESEIKAALAKDPTQYLNVYTSGADGYLGWAYFPNSFSESNTMHGVVIQPGSMPGGNIGSYNIGDTLTHEVGHYLGLEHTFDGGCNGGDGVADTPAESSPLYGCANRDSCSGDNTALGNLGITDTRDPKWNFMDYTDDYCMSRFTPMQAARMRSWLATFKPQLVANSIVPEGPAPPTDAPTAAPTEGPTAAPTDSPTDAPTAAPTDGPTAAPTDSPTDAPTAAPTEGPTAAPTDSPTDAPTSAPTCQKWKQACNQNNDCCSRNCHKKGWCK